MKSPFVRGKFDKWLPSAAYGFVNITREGNLVTVFAHVNGFKQDFPKGYCLHVQQDLLMGRLPDVWVIPEAAKQPGQWRTHMCMCNRCKETVLREWTLKDTEGKLLRLLGPPGKNFQVTDLAGAHEFLAQVFPSDDDSSLVDWNACSDEPVVRAYLTCTARALENGASDEEALLAGLRAAQGKYLYLQRESRPRKTVSP